MALPFKIGDKMGLNALKNAGGGANIYEVPCMDAARGLTIKFLKSQVISFGIFVIRSFYFLRLTALC